MYVCTYVGDTDPRSDKIDKNVPLMFVICAAHRWQRHTGTYVNKHVLTWGCLARGGGGGGGGGGG